MQDGAQLELKLVGDITERFFVPRYQRGYRWDRHEVQCLLDDIWNNGDKPYCLQPVVVKHRPDDAEWELVDGQQRLTTLYLLFLYMQREGLQSTGPLFTMRYEVRPDSEAYLRELDAARSGDNIDFFHLYEAFDCIRAWFDAHGHRRQHAANRIYGYLFDQVRVIWYEAPPELDSTDLFIRLNVGRIPLTDAELVKALLLSRSRGGSEKTDRAQELAAQWDAIERDLQRPEVWAFVTAARPEDYPTRITLLLDTLVGGPQGRDRPRFFTFDMLRKQIEVTSPETVWRQVLELHARLLGWFENRSLYHKIGYLVADGVRFDELVRLGEQCTKSSFEALLDERIRCRLDLSPADVLELSYESDTDREKCSRLLLLMNVETTRRMEHSSERFPFLAHRREAWSLEHIHAQHALGLNRVEQWKAWLDSHRKALRALTGVDEAQRDSLITEIDSVGDNLGRETFHELARRIAGFFTAKENGDLGSPSSVHAVSNLALLSCKDNSELGNAVFEVKRRHVLQLDRSGAYIPICTRRLFLKYYTDANDQQLHFWGIQDRERYLAAMISKEHGVIYRYLKPEVQEP